MPCIINRGPGLLRLSRLYQFRYGPLCKRGRPRYHPTAAQLAARAAKLEARMLHLLATARALVAGAAK